MQELKNELIGKVKCFYHTDLDGYCSGAIVANALGWDKVDFFPINYGHPFPWEKIASDDIVFMVDFSLQPYEVGMRALKEKCGRLIWIDHHKTEVLADVAWERDNPEGRRIEGWRIEGEAGCELTWKWFHGDKGMPRAVYMLGRYDVWKWEGIDHCMEFQMGMRSLNGLSPEKCWDNGNYGFSVWQRLLGNDGPAAAGNLFDDIRHDGTAVMRHRKKELKAAAESSVFMTELYGVPMLAANVGGQNSQFFDDVVDQYPEALALLTFHYRRSKWNMSMYQIKGRNTPNLGHIAKQLGTTTEHGGGGGGHPGAAGFQWHDPEPPFNVDFLTSPLRGDQDVVPWGNYEGQTK